MSQTEQARYFIYSRCADQVKAVVMDITKGTQVSKLAFASQVPEDKLEHVLAEVQKAAGPNVHITAKLVSAVVRSSAPKQGKAKISHAPKARPDGPGEDLQATIKRLQQEQPTALEATAAPEKTVTRSAVSYQLFHTTSEGWELRCGQGKRRNPPIVTAPAMASFICRHGLAAQVENLEKLGEWPAAYSATGRVSLAALARGQR